MNLLLDTHAFLWWRFKDRRIGEPSRALILSAAQVFVSLASAWEAAIKVRAGKLSIPEPFAEGVRAAAFTPLPIEFAHTERIASIPLHHRDPFDRMLVAQAQAEGLTLVSADRAFAAYDVDIHFL